MMLRKLLEFRRYPEFVRLLWWRKVTPLFLRRAGVDIGHGVQFLGSPIVSLAAGSRVTLGERASLCSVSRYTALGVNHPVILRTLKPGAVIKIGADTGISGASICAASSVSIGQQCLFGANVVITDTDFHSLKAENRRYNNRIDDIAVAPVCIEDNVFLGTGVIVLKGVTIGKNSVVGAGTIVARDVPPDSIVAGISTRILSKIERSAAPRPI